MKKPARRGEVTAWVLAHVNYAGDECLTWPFAHDGRGYGTLQFEEKFYKASRLICILAHGEPPTSEHQAAHSCGNGHLLCVNQNHLSWKTRTENMADSVKHGTARFDRGRPRVKLTVEQVREIIAMKGVQTQAKLAAKFGVSWRQIGKIQRGVSWRGGKLHQPGLPPGDPRHKERRRLKDGRFETAA